MDALFEAQKAMENADGGDITQSEVNWHLARAQAYAAIAQAEQLKRIADMMEHPNRIIAPDPQDYYNINDYNEAAEQHDYWKNSRMGETMNEYKARIAQPANRKEE